MGRFISEDTYEGQIDNPLSLNLYTYVINNPLKYVDPTGHEHEKGSGGGGGGGAGAGSGRGLDLDAKASALFGKIFKSIKNIPSRILGKGNETKGAGQASKWVDEAGNIKWPKNDGFAGDPKPVTLLTGTRIDRYGYENGKFVSPEGTPYGRRALAPGTESKPYNVYEVVKPFDAQGGKIAPWFDEVGGGTQYKFDKSIKELIDGGYLRRVER